MEFYCRSVTCSVLSLTCCACVSCGPVSVDSVVLKDTCSLSAYKYPLPPSAGSQQAGQLQWRKTCFAPVDSPAHSAGCVSVEVLHTDHTPSAVAAPLLRVCVCVCRHPSQELTTCFRSLGGGSAHTHTHRSPIHSEVTHTHTPAAFCRSSLQ